jgi:hypothetical protein
MLMIEATFDRVHRQLIQGGLNKDVQSFLQDSIGYKKPLLCYSDKAKRRGMAEDLRRKIISKFISNSWNKKALKNIIHQNINREFFEETRFIDDKQFKLLCDLLEKPK